MTVTDDDIAEAIRTMQDGGTVIFPTETCYGIGCDALNETAVERIYKIKQRPRHKKLTTVVASLEQAEQYCTLTDQERKVCRALMPGPLTLIAEKKSNVPDILNDAFAFRVSSHPICQQLAAGLDGPVVATSANISGQPSSYTVDAIAATIREQADDILDDGRLDEQPSSTVIDLHDGTLTVHRNGPITAAQVRQVLKE